MLWSKLALVGSLFVMGCSPHAAEYQCLTSEDCQLDGTGMCHESGYCAFADDTCGTGFRFGEQSGPDSNTCIAQTELESGPDAGTPISTFDAAPTPETDAPPPIVTPECEEENSLVMTLGDTTQIGSGDNSVEIKFTDIGRSGGQDSVLLSIDQDLNILKEEESAVSLNGFTVLVQSIDAPTTSTELCVTPPAP